MHHMRASRLLSLLLLLQTRGRLTAADLARELEVSLRTIYRDVEALAAAGIPLYADRGPTGGYQLLDGYRTRLTGLTGDEAASLALAGIPGPAAALGLGALLAAAQLKLHAALPATLRERIDQVADRFHLDAPAWSHTAEETPHLAAVAAAIWQCRALRVRYERWNGTVGDATLDPLGVILKAGTWYLAARSHGKVRTYRVSRLHELTTLDDTFERPANFDLAAFWQAFSERFRASLYHGEATVRLSPRAQELLFLLGPVALQAASQSASDPDPDGWIEARIPIESLRHAETDLLRFGADAEVVAPPELRNRLAAVAAAMVARYRDP
jgi:predicted DNA-binding transcriptional regulator YafY